MLSSFIESVKSIIYSTDFASSPSCGCQASYNRHLAAEASVSINHDLHAFLCRSFGAIPHLLTIECTCSCKYQFGPKESWFNAWIGGSWSSPIQGIGYPTAYEWCDLWENRKSVLCVVYWPCLSHKSIELKWLCTRIVKARVAVMNHEADHHSFSKWECRLHEESFLGTRLEPDVAWSCRSTLIKAQGVSAKVRSKSVTFACQILVSFETTRSCSCTFFTAKHVVLPFGKP